MPKRENKYTRLCQAYPHLKKSNEGPVYYVTFGIDRDKDRLKSKEPDPVKRIRSFLEITSIQLYADTKAVFECPSTFEDAKIVIKRVTREEGVKFNYNILELEDYMEKDGYDMSHRKRWREEERDGN